MKRLTRVTMLMLIAAGCQQPETYKKIRDEVMTYHDEVMADHGRILKNQLRLDTLLRNLESVHESHPGLDTAKERAVIINLRGRLQKSEESMNDWMHQFEPDITGKSNEEAIKYFRGEKLKIAAIDSLYKAEIDSSETYLAQFKKNLKNE